MDELEIVIATGNPNKVKEYQEIFDGLPVKLTSLKDEGISSDVDENGTSFEENALIKARAAASHTTKLVIADDSGLCVHGLNNFPGIYSARFMDGEPYSKKHEAIIERLKNVEDKSAHFSCAIAICNLPGKKEKVFYGEVKGTIVPPRSLGKGFGYDPIFQPDDYHVTFGEMSEKEKNSISHRAVASKKLLNFLKEFLNK